MSRLFIGLVAAGVLAAGLVVGLVGTVQSAPPSLGDVIEVSGSAAPGDGSGSLPLASPAPGSSVSGRPPGSSAGGRAVPPPVSDDDDDDDPDGDDDDDE